ncbi:MAG: hypothetical protein JGK17_09905 [Microcoleus sp. PH2017_10_PVI_O_A]|uniref:hypothetical protein n=1 Tax=unclassified Microcoleus TaxID=2642155 RepID=UPI001DD7DC02|nr:MULTISPECIES: hypothetical protein [unclassified Microcoleus]TAE85190.1 MAG: hypothetical protein EAZ83_03225 [Oscillatoriales cyanobacterium]MCC3405886.1 hypothetical protein [Microcoleus sp. PH2017_10_PVI_O_A]MCC3460455.1 hypothetical protein [Microcoleus sp. PH2017_11_PCY_U_A]MCC3478734.1 hypothetical protein [Microcoleus sp. PH2017_12_PCY_D_A]MCC3528864.1 hypothetical protein [Microcoleus sp. PH2017_21_RUC_O_A]
MCEFVFAGNEKRSHLSTKVRSSIYELMRVIAIGLNTNNIGSIVRTLVRIHPRTEVRTIKQFF